MYLPNPRSKAPTKRTPAILASAVLGLLAAQPALADKEPPELSEYDRHDLRVTSICAQGHVVVVAHSDVGNGGGLHMMQLEHVVDGRIVPMRCGRDGPILAQESDAGESQAEHEGSAAP
ncbi:MAG: hypothetical protein R3212_06510 [Xanthomonadales bacterium]|nr:hypothetical protein [Xanthomonadales bacterium]